MRASEHQTTPDADARRALLFLITINGMGPKRLRRLLDAFETPQAALQAPASEWIRLGLPASLAHQQPRGMADRVETMLSWLNESEQHHLVLAGEKSYPPQLADLPDAPAALFGKGDIRLMQEPQLAIVGARTPTSGGINNARAFARYLSAQGLVITSGLALGIDAAAHRGALAAHGATIAVMGTGPDIIYPREHRELAEQIVAQGGLLISEWPPGTLARKEHFPRRNRLISGLSEGVLIVEASLQSGSLITARLAAEQGREVFAIPGSIHNPLSRGPHRLIREGAKLVETAQDIFEELIDTLGARLRQMVDTASFEPEPTTVPAAHLDPEQQKILDCLGFDPQSADTLIASSGLTPAEVSSILLMLELAGHVTTLPGGLYVRSA